MTDQQKLINEVLAPVARIRARDARGSGTIISSTNGDTYVLTNRHVISGNIQYKEVWDELLKRKREREFADAVEVDIHRLDESGREVGLTTTLGEHVVSSAEQDLALLKLKDTTRDYPTVLLYPEGDAKKIPVMSELACTGAAMGEKPIVTFGHLNGMQIEIEHNEFWLSSANSIFGCSGGAIFTPRNQVWHYLGVPSRIRVNILGFSADAVLHMGYFIPIFRIYKWLRDNCYEYLWDIDVTEEDCDKRRGEKRDRELAIHFAREKS